MAVAYALLLHALMGLVSAMPHGPLAPSQSGVRPRLQCPQCFRGFKSHSAFRQHRAQMLRFSDGSGSCADHDQPHHMGWSGRGPRASGRVQDLGRPDGQLPGFTDSDSDSGRNDSPRRINPVDGGAADHQEPAEPDQAPADVRAPSPLRVYTIHTIQTEYIQYIHIHDIQSKYMRIHTYTYIYKHIQARAKTVQLRQAIISYAFHAALCQYSVICFVLQGR